MKGMKARHVLLISDSCYSGSLFGQSRSLPNKINNAYYQDLYKEKSRWCITSGRNTVVSDSGENDHSVFADQLLKALRNNKKLYITAQEIFTRIALNVSNNSVVKQVPLCGPIIDTGDEGGQFIFIASSSQRLDIGSLPTKNINSKSLSAMAMNSSCIKLSVENANVSAIKSLTKDELYSRQEWLAEVALLHSSIFVRRSAMVVLREIKSPLLRLISLFVITNEKRSQNLRETAFACLGAVGTAEDLPLLYDFKKKEKIARFGKQAASNAYKKLCRRLNRYSDNIDVI